MSNGQAVGAGAIRRYPYPFKSMLAICSDLDETPDRRAYWALMHFLNSRAEGPLGTGVGLEIGNSIYFDMPPDQFAYWNTDDQGRDMIRALIRSGHVDCLHSFGDLATTRTHAGRALEELAKYDCRLSVWVDHAVAPTNFGGDIMKGHGDVPGHPAYHADLSVAHGVRYVWRGRVTSVIGQDQPPSLGGIWNPTSPAASLRTLAKERIKRALSRTPGSRYRLHGSNRVITPALLRDGSNTLEFIRANPHFAGVSKCDTADGIADVITSSLLDALTGRGGACILYTHLGKRRSRDRQTVLEPAAVECFRRLAERQSRGDVLVTTTRRMLDFCRTRDKTQARLVRRGDETIVELSQPEALDRDEWNGLTLYVDSPRTLRIRTNGQEVTSFVNNPADESGRCSVSIPWTPLEFPRL